MQQLLEHTYLWAKQGGDVNVATLQDIFLFALAASALFFFLIHLFMPYTPFERQLDPRIDETPLFFLNFTRGQLLAYPFNVLGIPVMVTSVYPYPPGWPVGDLPWGVGIAVCILVFYIVPAFAQKVVDGKSCR